MLLSIRLIVLYRFNLLLYNSIWAVAAIFSNRGEIILGRGVYGFPLEKRLLEQMSICPFLFDNHQIRVIEKEGEPWFCARDVAQVLGYSDTTNAIKLHCKGVAKHHTPTPGGQQVMSLFMNAMSTA